jgi:hypothetical protein
VAIDAFYQIIAEEGKDLPTPKSMSKWQADKEYKGWAWGIVDVAQCGKRADRWRAPRVRRL